MFTVCFWTCCTYCWTLADLFLFFSPKVLLQINKKSQHLLKIFGKSADLIQLCLQCASREACGVSLQDLLVGNLHIRGGVSSQASWHQDLTYCVSIFHSDVPSAFWQPHSCWALLLSWEAYFGQNLVRNFNCNANLRYLGVSLHCFGQDLLVNARATSVTACNYVSRNQCDLEHFPSGPEALSIGQEIMFLRSRERLPHCCCCGFWWLSKSGGPSAEKVMKNGGSIPLKHIWFQVSAIFTLFSSSTLFGLDSWQSKLSLSSL